MKEEKYHEEEPQPIEVEVPKNNMNENLRSNPAYDLIQMRINDWKAKVAAQKPPRVRKLDPGTVAPLRMPKDNPRRLAGAVALGSIQVIMGMRPLNQLDRWLTYEIYDALAERTKLFARFRPHIRKPRAPMMVKQVHVQAIRTQPNREFPVEAAVTVFDGERHRAVALRMHPHRGQWKVCALEIG